MNATVNMNAITDLVGTISVTESTMSDEFVGNLCCSYIKMLNDLLSRIYELRGKTSRECLVAGKDSKDISIGSVKILMSRYLLDIVVDLENMLRKIGSDDAVIPKPLDAIRYGFKLWCQHTISALDKLDYGIECLYTKRTLSEMLPGYDCKTYYLYEHVKHHLSMCGFDDHASYWPSFINEAIYALKQSVIDLENDKFLIDGEKVENE